MFVGTARSRQLLSDSGAFADWATTTTTSSAAAIRNDDLSLGFNAGPTSAATGGTPPPPSWSNPNHRGGAINYNLPSDVGMVELRDVFLLAPAASFNHHHHHDGSSGINLGAPDPTNASNAATTALGVGMGVGVIPLLSSGPCLPPPHNMDDQGGNKNSGIQFWQQNQPSPPHHHHAPIHYNFSKKTASILDNASNVNHNSNSSPCLLQSGDRGGDGGLGGKNSASSGGTATCQDCGNQAKKDCPHGRCRTCCKSRGYDCSTHLKSTWVPAARRRERQLMVGGSGGGAGSTGSSSGAKKPRLISSQTTSHTSTSDTSSSHQDVGFKEALPGQVRAAAVFKCVRVTAVEDGEDEFAYQAVVKINGHVFKGFLYDQGVDGRDGFPDISELHLGGRGGNEGRNGGSSAAPIMDPSDVYGGASGGGGGLLGGSSYGNPIH